MLIVEPTEYSLKMVKLKTHYTIIIRVAMDNTKIHTILGGEPC